MMRALFLVPVGLFIALLAVFALGLGRDPSKLPSVLIDRPLPSFALNGLSGDEPGLASADFRGTPALLNVFASWCVACRQEHDLLLRLKSEGVPIQGLDWKDEPAAGAQWLSDHGDPYQRTGSDRSGRTGIDLGVTGVPETFVVDGRGRVRYRHIGPIEPEDWSNKIRPLLQRLKAES